MTPTTTGSGMPENPLTPAPEPPAPEPPEGVELHLAGVGTRAALLLTAPALLGGWLAARGPGVVGAAIAAAMVIGLLYLSAVVLGAAARRGGASLITGAYGGFLARLAIYGVVMALLAPLDAVHLPSMAITTLALVIATLLAQALHASKTPQLYWLGTNGQGTARQDGALTIDPKGTRA